MGGGGGGGGEKEALQFNNMTRGGQGTCSQNSMKVIHYFNKFEPFLELGGPIFPVSPGVAAVQ